MATVNKVSLHTEFDALKVRFELLLAVFMEKATPKGSHNSGLPSSQTGADKTARGTPGANGKGPRADAACSRAQRRVVETRTALVSECRACGHGLEGINPIGHERRVQVDIVFETNELTVAG